MWIVGEPHPKEACEEEVEAALLEHESDLFS
jgi:hypothetical protein